MFEKINIYPYRRASKHAKSRSVKFNAFTNNRQRVKANRKILPGIQLKKQFIKNMFSKFFTWQSIILGVVAFILGRAVLLGELMPFGVAFIAAVLEVFPGAGLLTGVAAIMGVTTIKTFPLAQVMVIVAAWLMIRSIPVNLRNHRLLIPGVVFAVTLISRTAFLAFDNSSPYNYISILFEAVFAFALTMVFRQALLTFTKKEPGYLQGEELFCNLVLFAGIIAGAYELQFGLVSLKGVLSRFAVLLSALVGGVGLGAAAGAVVAIIPGLVYGVSPEIVGAYAFAGLVAGICRTLGKPGVITGFALGNVILLVYSNDYSSLASMMAETGVASLFFILVPYQLYDLIKASLVSVGFHSVGNNLSKREKDIKEAFEKSICNWSTAFLELSHALREVSATSDRGREEISLHQVVGEAGKKVCGGCTHYSTCWEREFFKTYQNFLELFTTVEVKGKIFPEDISEDIKQRCYRLRELAITINCLLETCKVNRYWFQRFAESRAIVAEQLKALSPVINSMATDIESRLNATGGVENLLRQNLRRQNISCNELNITYFTGGKMEVYFSRPSCRGMVECSNKVAPIVSRLLDCSYSLATVTCPFKEFEEICTFRLYPDLNFQLEIGVAGTSRSSGVISGDNYSFLQLKGGKFALVLSDGMGSGPRAALESNTAVSLLEHLLQLGLDAEQVVKTINSTMLLRSSGESFVTLDLAIVDLYTGEANFIKTGAPPGFLLQGKKVSLIEAGSLPAGIVREIEIFAISRNLLANNILVMVTDGIYNASQEQKCAEEWLAGVLQQSAGLRSQDLAELYLNLAQTYSIEGEQKDDMTVLVARVIKRKSHV